MTPNSPPDQDQSQGEDRDGEPNPTAPSRTAAPVADEILELADDDVALSEDSEGAGDALAAPEAAAAIVVQALEEAGAATPAAMLRRYQAEIQGDQDRKRVALLEHEIGHVLEHQVGNEADAVKAYARALTADPTLRPNLWAVRRVFTRRKLWDRLLKLLDAEARNARDDGERAQSLLEKGYVYEDKLKDAAQARAAFEQARPGTAGAAATLPLWRMAVSAGDAGAERALAEELADRTREPARKVAVLLELAQQEASAERTDEALAVLRRALQLGTERARVLDAIERLCEKTGRTGDLLSALALKAQAAEAELDATLAGAAAGIAEDRAAERRRSVFVATSRRWAQASQAAGDLAAAARILEGALARVPDDPLLLEDLADLYEDRGPAGDEPLAEVLGRIAAFAAPGGRAALACARAEALARAGKSDEAARLLDEVERDAPGYLPLLALREREALLAGQDERLLEIYVRQAEAALSRRAEDGTQGDRAWAAWALTAAAALAAYRLGRPEDALAWLSRARELVPGYASAEILAEELLARLGRTAERIALLEERAARAAPDARAGLLETVLALQLDELGELEAALKTAERLRELLPADLGIVVIRCEILERLGRSHELAEALLALAPQVDTPELAADLQAEAGLILEASAGSDTTVLERARVLYRQALSTRPEHAPARAALRASYLKRRDLAGLAEIARARASGGSASAADLAAAAALSLATGRADASAELAERWLGQGGGASAARLLGWAAAWLGDDGRRAIALQREAETTIAGPRAAALSALGELELRHGRKPAALAALKAAIEGGEAAGAAPVAAEALLALVALRARADERDEVPSALERLALLLPDGDPGAAAAALSAAALRFPRDPAAGLATARHLLARPADGSAAAAAIGPVASLIGILSAVRVERPRDAIAAAEAAESAAGSPQVRAALASYAASLARRGGDPEGAAAAAARAAGHAPDDPVAAFFAYASASEPEIRARICAARASACEAPSQAALLVEAGDALSSAGRLAEAAAAYEAARTADPTSPAPLLGLRRLAQGAGDAEGQARCALALGLLLRDARGKAAFLVEAGGLLEQPLGRFPEAIALYRHALVAAPDDVTAGERLCDLLRRTGDSAGLVEALSFRIGARFSASTAAPAIPERAPLHVERAALYANAGQHTAAIKDYRRALSLAPGDRAVGIALAELLADRTPGESIELYGKAIATAAEPAERGRLHLRRSRLLAGHDDVKGALADAETAVKILGADPEALEHYGRLLEEIGDRKRAAAVLAKLAGRVEAATGVQARQRAAQLFVEAGDTERARPALEAAIHAAPLDVEAPLSLAALLRAGDPGGAARVLDEALSRQRRALAEGVSAPLVDAIRRIAAAMGAGELATRARVAGEALGGRPLNPAPGVLVAKPPSPGWFRRAQHPSFGGLGAELYEQLAEALAASQEAEPTSVGFKKTDRITGKQLAARAPIAATITASFGIAELEAWIAETPLERCEPMLARAARLALGARIADGSAPGASFALARASYLLRERLAPLVGGVGARHDAGSILGAAILLGGGPSHALGAQPGAQQCAQEVGKAIGRKERKQLAGLTARLASEAIDPARTGVGAALSAARSALLWTGDLASALLAVARAGGGRDAVSPAGTVEAVEMIQFALSQSFDLLRAEALR